MGSNQHTDMTSCSLFFHILLSLFQYEGPCAGHKHLIESAVWRVLHSKCEQLLSTDITLLAVIVKIIIIIIKEEKTHDLSLALCLSKSRFPRESKPSPRPMPRPLPPRPPRPPPRPLGGLSLEGLIDNK